LYTIHSFVAQYTEFAVCICVFLLYGLCVLLHGRIAHTMGSKPKELKSTQQHTYRFNVRLNWAAFRQSGNLAQSSNVTNYLPCILIPKLTSFTPSNCKQIKNKWLLEDTRKQYVCASDKGRKKLSFTMNCSLAFIHLAAWPIGRTEILVLPKPM
jgi:hypothetical protein